MNDEQIEEFLSYYAKYMSGFNIEVNDFLCCRLKHIQYKFPRSKKIRIRRKWQKRQNNYKTIEENFVYKVDDRIIMSSKIFKIFNKLKENKKV